MMGTHRPGMPGCSFSSAASSSVSDSVGSNHARWVSGFRSAAPSSSGAATVAASAPAPSAGIGAAAAALLMACATTCY